MKSHHKHEPSSWELPCAPSGLPALPPGPKAAAGREGGDVPPAQLGKTGVAGVAGAAVLPVGHFTLVLWLLPTVAAGRLWVGVDQWDTGASRLLHLCGGVRISVGVANSFVSM